MAARDLTKTHASLANVATDVALIPRQKCSDDLKAILADAQRWAETHGHPELQHAMGEAMGIANTGWTLAHEALAFLSLAKSHIDAGRRAEAKQAINVAREYLARWNGRAMRFEESPIDAANDTQH